MRFFGGRFTALNLLDRDINEFTDSFNDEFFEIWEVVYRQRKLH